MPARKTIPKPKYKALVGLVYPTNPTDPRESWRWKKVKAGQVVDDIPAKSIDGLLKRKRIEAVDGGNDG